MWMMPLHLNQKSDYDDDDCPNFLSLLLKGKIRRYVTEKVVSKEYSQVVNIPLFNGCI